jgi:ATP-dependent DNA helicase RecG
LRALVPTHEVAFQILDGEEVRFNEFSRAPLLRAFDWVETLFKPLNTEREFQSGLFRVAVPKLDQRAFREAIANAVTHRDYSLRGAVHVRLTGAELVISNPGGFVEGVTLDNLLTTEPRPRNPALADALKRIGLVERTGRGGRSDLSRHAALRSP